MVVHLLQEELQKKLSSTQMLVEVEVEVEEADLEDVDVLVKLHVKVIKILDFTQFPDVVSPKFFENHYI